MMPITSAMTPMIVGHEGRRTGNSPGEVGGASGTGDCGGTRGGGTGGGGGALASFDP